MFKNNKKIILTLLSCLFLFFPILAFSQDNEDQDDLNQTNETRSLQDSFGEGSTVEEIAEESGFKTDPVEEDDLLSGIVSTLINALLSILGVVFVILTIISGIRWMTAAGNEEQVTKAKSALKQSIIGIFIVAVSWGFWALILQIINQF